MWRNVQRNPSVFSYIGLNYFKQACFYYFVNNVSITFLYLCIKIVFIELHRI